MGSMVVVGLFLGGTLLIPSSVSLWEMLFRPAMRLIYGSSGRLGSSNVQRSKVRTTLTVAAHGGHRRPPMGTGAVYDAAAFKADVMEAFAVWKDLLERTYARSNGAAANLTVDFVDSLQGSGFKFVNPNASSSCAWRARASRRARSERRRRGPALRRGPVEAE